MEKIILSKRQKRMGIILFLLPIILLCMIILATGIGAVNITPMQVISILLDDFNVNLEAFDEQQKAVLEAIRLPRVVLGALIGASLGTAGASMQGLFRNPLADPGLLGISSGAALSVAISIVLGLNFFGIFSLPVFAFVGSIISTILIYFLAQNKGRLDIATMLLAGIAINAISGAGTGLMTFLATDDQLRTITFWSLGSLGGATWDSIKIASPFLLIGIFSLPMFGKALDAMSLGEANAEHLGIKTTLVKWLIVTLVSLCVGASVAVAGSIGFIGLIVPHLLRILGGASHNFLLPAAGFLGAILLVGADLIARTVVVPAELPIGIVTAILGAPFFLYLLLQRKKSLL